MARFGSVLSSTAVETIIGSGGAGGVERLRHHQHAKASVVPAATKVITLLGYSKAGDTGQMMPCRRLPGPYPPTWTHYKGWFRTADRYTDAGVEDATNGGYWQYLMTHDGIAPEWFGAVADYWTGDQINGSGAGGGVNPTPTDNRQAIIDAIKYLFVYAGFVDNGVTTVILASAAPSNLGMALIIFPMKSLPTGSIGLVGPSLGNYHDSNNCRLGVRGRQTRFSLISGLPVDRRVVHKKYIFIDCLGFGGMTDKPGVLMRSTVFMSNCSVRGFGGHGIEITANFPSSNANCFVLDHVHSYSNAMDGVYCQGADANAGYGVGVNCMYNGRWGINDSSFLANAWFGCHTSGNGLAATGYGGPYRGQGGGSANVEFVGCYSEGDQAPSYAGSGVTFRGGCLGSGVAMAGGVQEAGQYRWGGLSIASSYVDPFAMYIKPDGATIYRLQRPIGGPYDYRHIGYRLYDALLQSGGEHVLWHHAAGRHEASRPLRRAEPLHAAARRADRRWPRRDALACLPER